MVKIRIGNPSSTRGGKAIKYYELTERGVDALTETKKLHDEMWKEFIAFTSESLGATINSGAAQIPYSNYSV